MFVTATNRPKVFCIGCNKTGTTSIGAALELLGYQLGNQWQAELLVDDWARRDFRRILEYCETADAFQDIPFSLPGTFAALDEAFPNSKFVLTERNSADDWFDSLTRFHTKLIGRGRLPTPDDLRAFDYHGPGWLWKAHVLIHDVNEATLYNRRHYTRQYDEHVREVKAYFRDRPGDLLIVNLSSPNAMESLCRFVGVERAGRIMPHLNQSRVCATQPAKRSESVARCRLISAESRRRYKKTQHFQACTILTCLSCNTP